MLGHASSDDSSVRAPAVEKLVRRYWPAIYAYIRRSGRDVHEASDLTQGFITTVILQRALPEKADQSRGRFRSLLLTSLRNYLRERHRYDARRRPTDSGDRAAPVVSAFDIDAAEGRIFETPEAAFSYHWSAAMVRRVLDQVRASCRLDGYELHWHVFEARVARPLLQGGVAPNLGLLVERFDLEDAAAASNMIVTVKRRFARLLREEIRATLGPGASREDVEDELAMLLRDLHRPQER